MSSLDPRIGSRTVTWHVDPHGRRDLIPQVPAGSRFDLGQLALYLAQPALHGEFRPASPWVGWRLERETAAPVPASRSQLRSVFDRTVADLIADHDVVAVRVSGGMDSAAVLCGIERVSAPGIKVVVIVTEAVSDSGALASDQARGVVRSVFRESRNVETFVLPGSAVGLPPWSPVGPRLEAAPRRNAAAINAAVAAGATVMLSGDGADELLTVPAFLGAELMRADGFASLGRYLRDHELSDLVLTCLASASGRLRPRPESAAKVYTSVTSARSTPGQDILHPTYAGKASEWARRFDNEMRALTADLIAEGGWARAEAHFAVWPQDALHIGTALPIRSPFLEQPFLSHALGLPLSERWNHKAPTPYLRRKAPVACLLEPGVAEVLPLQKEGFSADLSGALTTDADTPTLVDLGLVQAARTVTDTATVLTLRALEDWLREAMDRGYEPVRS